VFVCLEEAKLGTKVQGEKPSG